MTDFLSSLKIAATGLHAQSARMRVIAENIANADSAGKSPGDEPYRRRIPTFQAVMDAEAGGKVVQIGRLAYDMSDFETRYEPGHPAADERGYVRYPNVNTLIEAMDMREAQRTYEANLNVVSVTRQMMGSTLDILRGRLGFDGLVFSDDLEMAGAHSAGDVVARADAAIDAGCDVVLLCNDFAAIDDLLARFAPPPQPHLARRMERMKVR